MVTGCQATPGCVAYVGISYLSAALADGLGEAQLANALGQYELPTPASISAAVAAFVSATPVNETISMVNGPASGGYPIVNYEYAIVRSRQPDAHPGPRHPGLPALGGHHRQFRPVPRRGPLPAAARRGGHPLRPADRDDQVARPMSTTLAERQSTATGPGQPPAAAAPGDPGGARHPSPDPAGAAPRAACRAPCGCCWPCLAGAALAWGALTAWTVSQHAAAAGDVVSASEPLSLDAQRMYQALSDADVTATTAFLAGPQRAAGRPAAVPGRHHPGRHRPDRAEDRRRREAPATGSSPPGWPRSPPGCPATPATWPRRRATPHSASRSPAARSCRSRPRRCT